jgi:hypothetical protein
VRADLDIEPRGRLGGDVNVLLDSISRIGRRLTRLRHPAVDLSEKREYLVRCRGPYDSVGGMTDGVQKMLSDGLQHEGIPDGQQPSCGGGREPTRGDTCAEKFAA